MAYQNDIPQPSDAFSKSQQDLLNNFAALKTLIDVNHETFGAANEGKHKWVSLPEQSSGPTTAVNEIALYTKEVSGASQLFLRNENNGSEVDFTSATKAQNGETVLPSGIKLKWGRGQTNAAGNATVTYTSAFTGEPYVVTATNINSGASRTHILTVNSITNTNFAVFAQAAALNHPPEVTNFSWFAIGV